MTIEAGKWYRTPEGQSVRAVVFGSLSCLWHVEDIDGRRWTWPAKQLTPWVPMVGEWVRADRSTFHDGPFRVLVGPVVGHVSPWVEVENADGGRLTARAGLFEPCLPPAEKIEPVQTTTTTTWNEAGGVTVPGSVRAVTGGVTHALLQERGANGTCPKCGGPAYVGLQNAECLAERCEQVEPEPNVENVVIGWSEWGYRASGGDASIAHPIRDEAIRLWREAVRRG